MTPRPARPASRWLACIAAVLILLVLGPAAGLAHADLVTSDPADGATLMASPVTITANYLEAFDTKRSSMELLGPDGATLATNEPATAATAESMTISGFGTLPAGTYSVRWTTITPDDNGIERGTFTFTLAAGTLVPGASPSAAPDAAATAAASPGVGAVAASGGVGDVVLPLVALAALVVVGLAWFLRRSR
jgi:methionine-rich copper-binding protein CopC